MNDLIIHTAQLPDTIEDLSKFVLVNEERIQALRAQIRAIKKVNLAKEVYEQKLAEAQEVGQITVEAAQKMGELLLQIQKQSGGDRKTEDFKNRDVSNFEKTKAEITSEMGMTKDQVSQYQQMAQNPEAVQLAIQKAIENGDVVSRSQVMKEIRSAKEEARRELQAEIDQLKADNRLLANRKPDVVEREIVPADYEETKRMLKAAQYDAQRAARDFSTIRAENSQLRKEKEQLEAQLGADKLLKEADRDVMAFTIATNDYIRRYGGHVWAFSEIANISEDTRNGFLQAIKTLDGFAQQLIMNIEGKENDESV